MVRQKQVCIIGAGVSGLAAAKAFAARGHQITIVERSGDLGGVWEPARSYPEVQTQSPKDLYRYTDKAMPDSYPEWPKGPQVHAYLTEYAKDNALLGAIRFNTAVMQMDRRPDSAPGWRLDLRGPDGGISHEDFDFVAVCTGQFNEPRTLSLPGEDPFKAQGGRILHSSRYNDPTIAKGCKVVVLGGSKSATDIAVNAVNSGASEVTLVYRAPVWRIPYFVGGLTNFKRIPYLRRQHETFASPQFRALPRDGQCGVGRHVRRRLQLRVVDGAVGRARGELAGPLCRQPARPSADCGADARQRRNDAGFQARGAAGGRRLRRAVRGAL